jgi:hypothetical protein
VASAFLAGFELIREFEPQRWGFILCVVRAGFDFDGMSRRIFLAATAEIFSPAAEQGTFDLHRIAH